MGSTFVQDVRYALRMLRKNKGFTAVAVLALALGIGANSAIFSVFYAILLKPLPYPRSERIVVLRDTTKLHGDDAFAVSAPLYVNWKEHSKTFEAIAAASPDYKNLTGVQTPERVLVASTNAAVFQIAGIKPLLGRTFTEAEEGHRGGVMVLSEAYWKSHFGGRPDAIGKRVYLNGAAYDIVGVMPAAMQLPEPSAAGWIPAEYRVPQHPLKPDKDPVTMVGSHYLDVYAAVKPGVSAEQLKAELTAISLATPKEQNEDEEFLPVITTLRNDLYGEVRPAVVVLFGSVMVLLLIACANVANLLLARANARRKEIAIRTAMGASSRRIVRQLLTESVLLAIIGGAVGSLVAYWSMKPLLLLAPGDVREAVGQGISPAVMSFTVLASIATGVLFGLVPALHVTRDSNQILKQVDRSASPSASRLTGALLISGEIALSLVLLIAAGLMVRSMARLLQIDPGFDPRNAGSVTLAISPSKYPEGERRTQFYAAVLRELQRIPGVEAVGGVNRLPMSGGSSTRSFSIAGRQQTAEYSAEIGVVTPGYFEAMRIPIVEGRGPTEQDRPGAPNAVVVTQSMARRFWPGEDVIGKQFKVDGWDTVMTVVGVAGDVKFNGLTEREHPEYFASYLQQSWPSMSYVIRTSRQEGLMASIREAVGRVDRDQPVSEIRPLTENVSRSIKSRRFSASLLGSFAAVALLLSTFGIYGVVSYVVSQRTHEIGIRMALGARPGQVLAMILRYGSRLAAAGMVVGVIGALLATRLLKSLLFQVSTTDVATFAGVSALLFAVALLACYMPARRASRVDPLVALRYE